MFLNLLTDDDQKNYFMKLAYLVALSDGDYKEKSKKGSGSGIFGAMENFHSIVGDLGQGGGPDYLMQEGSRFDSSEREMVKLFLFEMKHAHFNDVEHVEEYYLSEDINRWLSEAKAEVAKDSAAKRLIMLALAEKDMDLASIDQKDIEQELMNNPDTRGKIFAIAANSAALEAPEGLTLAQKKAMVFELIGMGHADGQFSEIEQGTVMSISSGLGIDDETLDDIRSNVKKIDAVVQESLELIEE